MLAVCKSEICAQVGNHSIDCYAQHSFCFFLAQPLQPSMAVQDGVDQLLIYTLGLQEIQYGLRQGDRADICTYKQSDQIRVLYQRECYLRKRTPNIYQNIIIGCFQP